MRRRSAIDDECRFAPDPHCAARALFREHVRAVRDIDDETEGSLTDCLCECISRGEREVRDRSAESMLEQLSYAWLRVDERHQAGNLGRNWDEVHHLGCRCEPEAPDIGDEAEDVPLYRFGIGRM